MIDLNILDDMFDGHAMSNRGQMPSLRLQRWYKNTNHGIRKLLAGSIHELRDYRIVVALCTIHFLIWLQTHATTSGHIGHHGLNYQALNHVRVLELQMAIPNDRGVLAQEGIMVETLGRNGSHEAAPILETSLKKYVFMEQARDIASSACLKEEKQVQANMQILVKVTHEDASAYFSLRESGLEQSTQGGFLFDCPGTQPRNLQRKQQQKSHGDIKFISEHGKNQGDLVTWTAKPSSSQSGSWVALYNVALALLSAVIVRWCSTSWPLAPKPEVSQPSQVQYLKSRSMPIKARINEERLQRNESPKKNTPPPAQVAEISNKSDDEIVHLGVENQIRLYSLEAQLGNATRAVEIRRRIVSGKLHKNSSNFVVSGLPFKGYDYQKVMGACCENVIGYLPVPVGVAGPLDLDGRPVFLPMATTEGALVASTNRGCTAINMSGGITSILLDDGMTRGPCVRFPNLERAAAAKIWLDSEIGLQAVEKAFNSTSRFGRLQSIKCAIAGSDLYIRFKARTGDAMGMNMISKGVERALTAIIDAGFHDMSIVSISGNYCTDKKAAAVNWIDGRGKSVVAQATISAQVLKKVLKTDVDSMVDLNTSKNLIGSCMAGSIGGFNAHAANIVSSIFLATGQDIAQVVGSSSCLTTMRNVNSDLQISVSMPSIEVGTVGGGTVLEAQSTMLDLLGVRGANQKNPGGNAQELARMVAAGVLAGELSLCSALAAGSLVKSHMALNRK